MQISVTINGKIEVVGKFSVLQDEEGPFLSLNFDGMGEDKDGNLIKLSEDQCIEACELLWESVYENETRSYGAF